MLSYACYKRGTPFSIVIAMDLRNDVASRISAVIFAYIGDKYWRIADPIGAIVLSTIIAISWFRHAVESVPQLVGRRAEQEEVSRILRIAIEHDERIRCLDHFMVYHMGTKAFVELHIVMDERLPLKVCRRFIIHVVPYNGQFHELFLIITTWDISQEGRPCLQYHLMYCSPLDFHYVI
ncbi:hypothetical protein COOONC_19887 [Cooperia oncophora]